MSTARPPEQAAGGRSDSAAPEALEDLDALEGLETERDFLLASIADLDDEHRLGDVSDDDYTQLRDSYTTRAADVLRAIGAAKGAQAGGGDGSGAVSVPTGSVPTRTDRRRSWLLTIGVTLIAAAAVVALILATGVRLPGSEVTGGTKLPVEQQVQQKLDQAVDEENAGQYQLALQLYAEVLSMDPKNAVALANMGWVEFDGGVNDPTSSGAKSIEKGEAQEEKAVQLEPSLGYAHVYLGTMYYVEGRNAAALTQYERFLALKPSEAETAPFLPDIKGVYAKEKKPLPASLASSTTTTTPTP